MPDELCSSGSRETVAIIAGVLLHKFVIGKGAFQSLRVGQPVQAGTARGLLQAEGCHPEARFFWEIMSTCILINSCPLTSTKKKYEHKPEMAVRTQEQGKACIRPSINVILAKSFSISGLLLKLTVFSSLYAA